MQAGEGTTPSLRSLSTINRSIAGWRGDRGIARPDRIAHRQHDRDRGHAVVIEGHHVGIASVAGGDQAVFADGGDRFVVAAEAADGRDVFRSCRRSTRPRRGAARLARLGERDLGRDDREADELGVARLHARGPVFHPAAEDIVLPASLGESQTAAVVVGRRRLVEDQAFRRVAGFDPRVITAGQGVVIGLEVIAKERKPEPALTLERSVAGRRITAHATHHGKDVPAEIGRFFDLGGGKSARQRSDHLTGENTPEPNK